MVNAPYALLHLSGLKMSAWMRSRASVNGVQNHQVYPEFGHTAGIDATTGPLGQGISTATGFAQAERFLGSQI